MPNRPSRHKPSAPATKRHEVVSQYRAKTNRMYGYRWQKAREWFLRKHPLCVQCEREGIVTAANVVDHIIPHKGDKELFWQRDNWQPLCVQHHNAKTAKEDGGFGNAK